MKAALWLTLISALLLSACAPRGNGALSSAIDTETFPAPVVKKAGDYEVIQGATQAQDLTVQFESGTKKMALQGKMLLTPVGAKNKIALDVDLRGSVDDDGFAILKPTGSIGVEGLVLAAKATCLGFNGDCSSSFVDIYISYQGRYYHHQVESVDDSLNMPEEVKQADDDHHDDAANEETEQDDDHEDSDEVDSAPGGYVGDVQGDLEKVLDVKPKTDDKKEQPKDDKKEQPKDDKKEDKKDDGKKDEPGKKDDAPVTPKPKPKPAPKQDPKDNDGKEDKGGKDNKDDKKDEDKKDDKKDQGGDTKVDTPKKVNQAIGSVNDGRLENANDLLAYEKSRPQVGFHILRPERNTHFSTSEMAYLLAKMGRYTLQIAPGHVLRIGDISKKNGGSLGSHKSHQNGLDADIAFYFKADKSMTAFSTALKGNQPIGDWMMVQQWNLLKYVVSSKYVDRIFIHPALKKSLCQYATNQGEVKGSQGDGVAYETLRRLIPESGHYNHFHMRIKCSQSQVRCRQMPDPPKGTGC